MHLPSQLAATLLGLGMLSAGAIGASAQSAPLFTAGPHAASAVTQQAPLRTTKAVPSQDPRCAADQANDASERHGSAESQNETNARENPADTDNLQCGDQGQDTGTTGAVTQHAPVKSLDVNDVNGKLTLLQASRTQHAATAQPGADEQEAATEAERGNDQETDGIVCEQQGEHEGENVGC